MPHLEPPLALAPPRYWRSLEERDETAAARQAAEDEFVPGAMDPSDPPPAGLSRRNFFQLAGAAAALATASACEPKGQGSIVPYTKRPPEIVPGVADFYASTFQEGSRAYPVLVKTREGRPIHITGNDEHPGFRGKTSPRAMADLLRLYDPDRLRNPMAKGRLLTWPDAEARLLEGVKAARVAGKRILLLSGASPSPTRRALLAELKRAVPELDHLAWEPAAGDAQLQAAKTSFGLPVELRSRLSKAQVVLSLGCDFLNGEDPEAIAAFAARRRLQDPAQVMNRLWVLEGPMTLTGSNADQRLPVKPSVLGSVAFALAKDLNAKHGVSLPAGADLSAIAGGAPAASQIPANLWDQLLQDLKRAGKEAAVLCGPQMPAEAHQAVHLLNAMLASTAVDSRPAEGLATAKEVEEALAAGSYGAVICWGANPAFALARPVLWKEAAARTPFVAWIGVLEDETAASAHLLFPESHWLESWNDFEAGTHLCLQQPSIGPLYGTKQGEELLLGLLKGLGGPATTDYHIYLQARWSKEVQPPGSPVPFDRFFQAALHDGVVPVAIIPSAPAFIGSSVAAAARKAFAVGTEGGLELVLFPGTQVHDGRYANNGWLQECPDPVTKMTWTNVVSLAVADARKLGLKDGDIARVEAGGHNLQLPVVLQPGQATGVVAIALGYGREIGSVGKGHGANAFPLLDPDSSHANVRAAVKVSATGARTELSRTQGHHRMEGRDLVRSWTVAEFAEKAKHEEHAHELFTLYPPIEYPDQKWGMVIDLSACVGCSGCVVACQSENNIPVVGPEQVAKGREMHWIRIDRYYEGDLEDPKTISAVHQPMLCQHCDHAPCENVCPVNATNHSPDGLNQMAYNRCVGTRYCANNCPYKVRRFNFFEYTADKVEPETLVYNPEVTVRPRGVMEKCTFCVQKIQDVKVRAKGDNRPVRDGEVVPACAAGCPAEAIVFGNLNDKSSRVYQLSHARRGYKVLEELGARPAVTYLADLKNPAVDSIPSGPKGGAHAS
jgi:molybdopterin-containing oxidoreductase family iron-sulfur binding subunit